MYFVIVMIVVQVNETTRLERRKNVLVHRVVHLIVHMTHNPITTFDPQGAITNIEKINDEMRHFRKLK